MRGRGRCRNSGCDGNAKNGHGPKFFTRAKRALVQLYPHPFLTRMATMGTHSESVILWLINFEWRHGNHIISENSVSSLCTQRLSIIQVNEKKISNLLVQNAG